MSWSDRLKRLFTGGGADSAGRDTEGDVPVDTATASSRATGGVEDPDAVASNSTTGTTPNEEFVGRVSGDETDVGMLGGEVRAEYEKAHPEFTDNPGEPEHRTEDD
jgi:hypothetical protein